MEFQYQRDPVNFSGGSCGAARLLREITDWIISYWVWSRISLAYQQRRRDPMSTNLFASGRCLCRRIFFTSVWPDIPTTRGPESASSYSLMPRNKPSEDSWHSVGGNLPSSGLFLSFSKRIHLTAQENTLSIRAFCTWGSASLGQLYTEIVRRVRT